MENPIRIAELMLVLFAVFVCGCTAIQTEFVNELPNSQPGLPEQKMRRRLFGSDGVAQNTVTVLHLGRNLVQSNQLIAGLVKNGIRQFLKITALQGRHEGILQMGQAVGGQELGDGAGGKRWSAGGRVFAGWRQISACFWGGRVNGFAG